MGLRQLSKLIVGLGFLCGVVLAPSGASAQDQAGIAGTVRDNTGGALPGVTVVAASPALIEQRRTVVTDGAGNYSIVSLPSGTYAVTFTLQGFSTILREGIVLQGAFVADVDAEMSVGAVTETLTVTGQAPQVDVVSTRQQTVLTAERVHALPASTSVMTAAQYVPGVSGTALTQGAVVHGSDNADGQTHVDGIKSGMQLGSRNNFVGGIGLVSDEAAVSEMVFDTSSQGAEFAQSGVRSNVVFKTGSNTFNVEVYGSGTRAAFQSNNLSPELEAQGFRFAPQAWTWSLNPSLGGPIVRNKLWFFASYVKNKSKNYLLDIFFNPDDPTTPEGLGGDLRAFNEPDSSQQQIRLTHQLTDRHKLTYSFVGHENNFPRVVGTGFGRVQAEALFDGTSSPTYMTTVRWTAPLTNRLLIEATGAYQRADLDFRPLVGTEGRAPFRDIASGVQSNRSFLNVRDEVHKRVLQASVSYVTGSHNFKGGLNYMNNLQYYAWIAEGDIFDTYLFNGAPTAVLVTTNGSFEDVRNQKCDCGLYAQDAWTIDRLTLNLGLRFDWFSNSFPGGTRPAGYFSPALTVGATESVPDWRNWNGRFGGAYDLFGDSRTAVKAFAGRYVANEALGFSAPFNPIATPNVDYRPWIDRNGDGTPMNRDGTPQLNEILPGFNPNFGTAVTANKLDPNTPRGKNWEYSAGVQHQLLPGWSVSGTWHRRRYYDFYWADNLRVSASDFIEIPFTAPRDPRLPNGGGEQITVYGFRPGFVFSSGSLLTTEAPDNYRTWNGFEVIANGQLWRSGFVNASWTAGATVNHMCQSGQDNPNNLRFCHAESPYRHDVKISGAVPLPFDTMIAGLFQVFAGGPVAANYTVGRGDVGPVLTNNTSNQVTVNLIEPYTQFYDATTSLQLRFSKTFTTGRVRTRAYVNTNNIFNRAAVTSRNQFFGGNRVLGNEYLRPIAIQAGRQVSFGFQTAF